MALQTIRSYDHLIYRGLDKVCYWVWKKSWIRKIRRSLTGIRPKPGILSQV